MSLLGHGKHAPSASIAKIWIPMSVLADGLYKCKPMGFCLCASLPLWFVQKAKLLPGLHSSSVSSWRTRSYPLQRNLKTLPCAPPCHRGCFLCRCVDSSSDDWRFICNQFTHLCPRACP